MKNRPVDPLDIAIVLVGFPMLIVATLALAGVHP